MACDNEAAVRISEDPVCHSRTKHVAVSFWFVREVQDDGEIRVHAISTQSQLADILTKSLNKPVFEVLRSLNGLVEAPDGRPKKGE